MPTTKNTGPAPTHPLSHLIGLIPTATKAKGRTPPAPPTSTASVPKSKPVKPAAKSAEPAPAPAARAAEEPTGPEQFAHLVPSPRTLRARARLLANEPKPMTFGERAKAAFKKATGQD